MDSWTAKENNKMWLRDLLPNTTYFKQSRIMTFGYDGDKRAKGTVMNLEDWAQTLLTSVNSVRMSEEVCSWPSICPVLS
jgi:hypothetical protein